MKMVSLAVMLVSVSFGAAAEWVELGDNASVTVYADPSTIRIAGNIRKMWHLMDYKAIQNGASVKPYLSSKDQSEYDCKSEQSRTIFFQNHAERHGDGSVVYSLNEPFQWAPTPPGSIAERLWQFACAKV